ncbi:putative bifunctional diguanylate cyclase/phosphodiesterase [Inhella sp.]|uniref:putative bifunctional diguanylate cyclase/phosphodiesterase n=1 Tax=Inhella sp. TaxID=1921806 RepID=UPI0035B49957
MSTESTHPALTTAPISRALQAQSQLTQTALACSERRLRSLLALSVDWIWEQDAEGRICELSGRLLEDLGLQPELLLGRRIDQLDGFEASEPALHQFRIAAVARRPFRDFDFQVKRPDGRAVHVRGSGEPVFDTQGGLLGYRGVARDVTAEVLAAREADRLARYDALTGLPNRGQFLQELTRAMSRSKRSGHAMAVGFLDLDRFKTVNDTLGHAAGDELLRVMATRLRKAVREVDTVGRLGGDEFALLFEACGDRHNLRRRALALLETLGQPIHLHERSFMVTGSIGLAFFPEDGEDSDTLLMHADAAMYRTKEQGRNGVNFYDASLAARAERQFEIESTLRMGLARGELLLHYQPKVCARSGRLLGLEALLRWNRPGHGLVPPSEFIPLAEERGLILPIGRWVIRQACEQLARWRAQGLSVPPLALNVSAHQFGDPGLLDDLGQAMRLAGLPAGQLELELTESVLMAEPERARRLLRRMAEMGVRIAIDDFGTGYSSLSYLKRFPARTLKIDRSFVRGLPGKGDDAAIVQAVIALAHSLGLAVVAEGVETDAQLQALRGLGCDQVQGYLTGRPMPAAEVAAMLASYEVQPA